MHSLTSHYKHKTEVHVSAVNEAGIGPSATATIIVPKRIQETSKYITVKLMKWH